MGGILSRRKVSVDVYRFLSAVASSLRLGWLGTDNERKEMKVCKDALFPYLVNISAAQDDITTLKYHMMEGADILSADGRGRTALHVAAGHGNIKTVSFLLRFGADVNATDHDGETPLQDAIRFRSLKVVEKLVSAGACLEKSTEDLGAEMCCLAFLGDTAHMEAWNKAGVSLNVSDAKGRTPLHVAVCSNQMEMVTFCIRNGSDPEQRDKMNNRPVDDAHRLGFDHLVELLSTDG